MHPYGCGVVGNDGGPYKVTDGSVNVHIPNINNRIVNELFNLHTSDSSPLAVAVTAGDTSVEVNDDTVYTVGDVVEIHNGVRETTFPIITDLPGLNVLTFDRPLDFGYDVGDDVDILHTNLKTSIGSLASPIIHVIKPGPTSIWFINRIILTMTHTNAGADDKFGDLTSLTNGVVLRANINGQYGSFTNWKNNGDIRRDMYDFAYSDKAGGPAGFGSSGRGSFNRVGVSVRLDGSKGDFMDVLVQDNITGLDSFFINAQGYFEVI